MLMLRVGGNDELHRYDALRYHDIYVHSQFHKYCFWNTKYVRDTRTETKTDSKVIS
jgi:hypothetical protein